MKMLKIAIIGGSDAGISPQFDGKDFLDDTLKTPGIRLVPFDLGTAYNAGMKWKAS